MAESVDVVVIGAGVVGLACARRLALAGRDVVVLERHDAIGSETSSRNSEVIHAGIYYPTGSLKAQLCVAGKAALYDYCASRGIEHRRCGKVIVATSADQLDTLRSYQRQARANGVGELRWLDRRELGVLEPAVEALAGVLSPSTGIIDSHGFMLSLQGELEAAGGMVALGTRVLTLRNDSSGLRLATDALELAPRLVVNSAGLSAPALAQAVDPSAPSAYYARGHYYAYSGRSPFNRLIYPVAEAGGLGVHVTLDLAGQARFGPDVLWLDGVDYSFDDSRRPAFVSAIQRYFPGLEPQRLHPGYTGIRPKISGPGEAAADFRIDAPAQHGVPGLINLLGIESPGLTASLAIADRVARLVEQSGC
ncbi:MAG: NAD(P)/FAD-dependent oxidoreductase [Pseudomonadales bacterium]